MMRLPIVLKRADVWMNLMETLSSTVLNRNTIFTPTRSISSLENFIGLSEYLRRPWTSHHLKTTPEKIKDKIEPLSTALHLLTHCSLIALFDRPEWHCFPTSLPPYRVILSGWIVATPDADRTVSKQRYATLQDIPIGIHHYRAIRGKKEINLRYADALKIPTVSHLFPPPPPSRPAQWRWATSNTWTTCGFKLINDLRLENLSGWKLSRSSDPASHLSSSSPG